jgi:hypothetical protein
MNTFLNLLVPVLLIAGLAWLAVRTIRADRPASPPGSLRDWRDEQLEWRHVGIS